ncbi:DNA helicase/exodeoxyribonuclease V subunit B [Rhodopseudomonas faecalis]|uniref:DNA helicase/exodeoxyribonuclease V subunit B n=1 Tax=Rhodopseudomonas faecalis TaxID=99655 RepID=A0A318TES2_9BRAD|nr:double-strand break repair protein AddB [Rhodopseudomonas faecalis]PYF02360.1 DNA helicase/exodeoxyribonuclease V subunit B [Rhodopseudomonas faecalis]
MRVFNIPPSAPFLRTLITALVDGELIAGFAPRRAPELLAQATLYLPTRRAMRLARETFLEVLGGDAAILPRIVALGDIDEDELAFAEQTAAIGGAATLELPPTLSELDRRLALAMLVGAWAKQLDPTDPLAAPLVVSSPASAIALATELARLMDDMATRDVDWKRLDGLVPGALDRYWQLTLDFLKIARDWWPRYLAEIGCIEPVVRHNRLLTAEMERLRAQPSGPVIAAGSTGSMPTTARFLATIAALPQGAVVLPGLDTELDDDAWRQIGASSARADDPNPAPPSSNHPQFALFQLLNTFGITRADVRPLGAAVSHARETLLSEALRPSSATAHWHHRLQQAEIAERIAAAMQTLTVIAADNAELEALAIAVAMRESYAQNRSAALVTPDRALARRVVAALGRWQLPFDDSGGDALVDTSVGVLARLAAEAASAGLEPATLLALLKHPLLRLGAAPGAWSSAIETLEIAVLRGTRPPPGSAGLAQALARLCSERDKLRRGEVSMLHRSELRAQLGDDAIEAAQRLVTQLGAALAPLETLDGDQSHDLAELAKRHRAVLTALTTDAEGIAAAFDGLAGAALARAFDDMPAHSHVLARLRDYPEAFTTLYADRMVRRPEAVDAPLRIFGPLEARLTDCDRVILGGLVEGIWPPAPRVDPWLSRPMRHQLGLDLPERRIGLSAHDFAQLLGHDDVILTHAAKVGGAPAVTSRFLHRLKAVAGDQRWSAALGRGASYLSYAAALDRPAKVEPIGQPMPRPPRSARPLQLSVTAIEDWLRDPYTIYAKYILKLAPLDPVDMPLSAADRGSAIHAAIGEFTERFAAALPDDGARVLREIGAKHFAPLMQQPEARALWWPRFLRIADWFLSWENERRGDIKAVLAEQSGRLKIPLSDGRHFVLTARADRIERRTDGSYALLDYKTGQPPSAKQVMMGLSPQLTLEAAILRDGGFDGIPATATVSEFTYVRLSGNSPPGENKPIELKRGRGEPALTPDDAADQARAKLEWLVRKFDSDTVPYTSLDLPMWASRYGSYDDLARIKEWAATSGDER